MSFCCTKDTEEFIPNSQYDIPVSSSFLTNHNQVPSQTTDTTSLNSGQTSEYEDTGSVDHQASSSYQSFLELQQPEDRPLINMMDAGLLNSYFPVPRRNDYQEKQATTSGLNFVSLSQENGNGDSDHTGFVLTLEPRKQPDVISWEEVLEPCTTGFQDASFQPSISSRQPVTMGIITKQENALGLLFSEELSIKNETVGRQNSQEKWQQNGHPVHNILQVQLSSAELGCPLKSNLENNLVVEGHFNDSSSAKQLLDCSRTDEGLKKFDSFNQWMSKELREVDESHMQSSSGVYWNDDESGNVADNSKMSPQVHLDAYLLSPSLSHDQLFSIIDFSPNWAYTDLETKVLITGTFLKKQQDVEKCNWSCMFGEVEVPAEVLADGILRCHAPLHTAGRVPFYVTCSNRLACSEVREFEYRVSHALDVGITDLCSGSTSDMLLHMRLGKLLSLGSANHLRFLSETVGEEPHLCSKISSLMKHKDEWFPMVQLTSEAEFSPDKVKEQLLQKLLKEKLHVWLLHKISDDGKGPCVLDKEGQGVLHLAAALGYDWAIEPTIAAGVNINFRDVNGWTALHWAGFCGRERTVVALVHLGAAPGALTDPTSTFPSGRTPADLAAGNGHKGIAGYLAGSSLSTHLSSLTLKDTKDVDVPEIPGVKAVQTVSEHNATPYSDGDASGGLSLKYSLTAVCNAAQAAARIHQVFRVLSFHQKQLTENGDDKFGMSDERALSLVSVKTRRPGQHDEPVHSAAIRIQNKFRGWKGRKEFLIIRQRIVKIQAHVRGHQVRKHYKKIIWSVGIVEKAILRWRRKGSGLRGFRTEALIEGPNSQIGSSTVDDYDFLKEGRKQTEERLQKALSRVRSMVQYPEARDQYHRLLNVVAEFQETKVMYDRVLNSSEEVLDGDDDLIDLKALLDDDTFMSTAC